LRGDIEMKARKFLPNFRLWIFQKILIIMERNFVIFRAKALWQRTGCRAKPLTCHRPLILPARWLPIRRSPPPPKSSLFHNCRLISKVWHYDFLFLFF
jgi:hypothetical protein